MTYQYVPIAIIPKCYTAIINPTGAALAVAQQNAIATISACNEIWYIVPNAALARLTAFVTDEDTKLSKEQTT